MFSFSNLGQLAKLCELLQCDFKTRILTCFVGNNELHAPQKSLSWNVWLNPPREKQGPTKSQCFLGYELFKTHCIIYCYSAKQNDDIYLQETISVTNPTFYKTRFTNFCRENVFRLACMLLSEIHFSAQFLGVHCENFS